MIDTEEFSECFSKWVADLSTLTEGEVIAIDGKCLRRSIDKASKKAAIYHLVKHRAIKSNFIIRQTMPCSQS